MGWEWGCRVLPKLKELALTRKADGGLWKGQKPFTPRRVALGNGRTEREELQGRWQFPMGTSGATQGAGTREIILDPPNSNYLNN